VDKGKVDELLAMVGPASEQADKYPHQLSGGQARRVGIARALALHPDILIADEPTAGLDVSVAAGILNLLKDLREQFQLAYIISARRPTTPKMVPETAGIGSRARDRARKCHREHRSALPAAQAFATRTGAAPGGGRGECA